MSNYKEHYKEIDPMATVNTIKKILNAAKIEVEEHWLDASDIGTYTMRLTIKGSQIGTNGKGVSREFATASAYAEFMERLENDLLWGTQWIQCLKESKDAVKMTAGELIDADSSFIKSYMIEKGIADYSHDEKVKLFEQMEILHNQTEDNNQYVSIPFLNLRTSKLEYLPASVYPLYYGSNGMCSGNTKEEALVQGLSEIIERYVQTKCLKDNISFPNIPEQEIKKYPYVWDMYKKVKNIDGIEVWMKDCSMGGKYPVAALLVLQKNTGKYGFKIGCHPIISIAMERALTEATQGQNIIDFAMSSYFDFTNTDVAERYNIENAMKVGIAQYPFQLFNENSTYEYVQYEDLTKYTNSEILKKWIQELLADGCDILVRDASYLGFNAYHIIMPGMSETRDKTIYFSKQNNTRLFSSYLLKDITNVNKNNLKYIVGSVESYMMSINENRLSDLFSVNEYQELPGSEIHRENELFCSFAYFVLGNYDKSIFYINNVIGKAISATDKMLPFYLAVKHYVIGAKIFNNHNRVLVYIQKLFDADLAKKIDKIFCNPDALINVLYGKYCKENSESKVYFDFLTNLQEYKERSSIDQLNLINLLA